MGNHDEGQTEFLTGLEEKVENFVGVLSVKSSGRLVRHDDVGIVDKRAGDRNTLLLTSGKLARQVAETVAEVEGLNKVTEVLLIAHVGLVAHHGRDEDVLKRGELRNEVVTLENESHVFAAEASELVVRKLGDLRAVYRYASRIGLVETCAEVKEGGLTGTGGTDDRRKLTLRDLDACAVYCGDNGVGLFILLYKAVCLKHYFCHISIPLKFIRF